MQSSCAGCGHPLPQVGRFCTNCGLPVGAQPAVVADAPPAEPVTEPVAEPPAEPAVVPPSADRASATPTEPWFSVRTAGPVAGVVLALVLVAAVGAWLLFGTDGGAATSSSEPRTPATRPMATTPIPSRTPVEPEVRTPPSQQRGSASVTVPATAEDSTEYDGSTVSFSADHLLDGDPSTTWRMPGDGSGSTVTFTFPQPVTLTKVGLVNGYAKTSASGLDWYHGNRRVTAVEWVFDDGTTVEQDLGDTRGLQRTKIDPVSTTSVQLRLLEVTPPGSGEASRDFTAISDVTLVGLPGS